MRWLRLALRVLLAGGAVRIVFLLAAYFLGRAGVERRHLESTFFFFFALALVYLAVLGRRPPREERTGFPSLALLAVAGVCGLALYWPALTIGWLSDDWVLQDWARRGEFVGSSHEFVRPMPLLLWRGLFALGAGAAATHLLNLALHVTSTLFTGLLARELGAPRQAAWSAAAVFLVWPTQVETLMWTSAVFDAVMTTSVLALVLLYARWSPELTIRRVGLLLVVAVAALLSKETAVALPALLLVVAAPRWIRTRPARAEIAAFVLLSTLCGLYLAWRVLLREVASGTELPRLTRYALKELLSRTFAGLAVPFDADAIGAYPMGAALVALILVVMGSAALIAARERQSRHVLAVQGLAWALFSTAPAVGYFLIGPYLQGSRYLHLAAAGWAWFVAGVTRTRGAERHHPDWTQVVVITALVVVAVLQDRRLITGWRAAAELRETVLAQAREIAVRDGCVDMRLASPPAPPWGTQLFLNGFEEAFKATTALPGRGAACVVAWDGTKLRRQ
jgi:hypothetical protein